MPRIGLLDETKGACRLLLALYKTSERLNTTQLQNRMDELYNVKKGAVATAVQICGSLGLIKIEQGTQKPRPATYHSLTEKGKRIAQELSEVERILEEN